MILHIRYRDGQNPFVSLGNLSPAACLALYRRKAREYKRPGPPPLFDADPRPARGTLAENADMAFYFRLSLPDGGPPVPASVHNTSGGLWFVSCAGCPLGCYYTSPGRALAALRRRTGGGIR